MVPAEGGLNRNKRLELDRPDMIGPLKEDGLQPRQSIWYGRPKDLRRPRQLISELVDCLPSARHVDKGAIGRVAGQRQKGNPPSLSAPAQQEDHQRPVMIVHKSEEVAPRRKPTSPYQGGDWPRRGQGEDGVECGSTC